MTGTVHAHVQSWLAWDPGHSNWFRGGHLTQPGPMRLHPGTLLEYWVKCSRLVMSDSSRPHGLQPTRLLRPWDFPGKSTGVGCLCFSTFFLLKLLGALRRRGSEPYGNLGHSWSRFGEQEVQSPDLSMSIPGGFRK